MTDSDPEWEDPLDSSPVATPAGWEGGAVTATGGSIRCRVWQRTLDDHDDLEGLQVEYDVTNRTYKGPTATEFDASGHRDVRETDWVEPVQGEWTDENLAEAAVRLMKRLNKHY